MARVPNIAVNIDDTIPIIKCHGEALYRPGAETEQHDGRDKGGNVGVRDGAECLAVA